MKKSQKMTNLFREIFKFRLALALVLPTFCLVTQADDDVIDQLLSLQERMHLQINGLEKVQTETKVRTFGSLEQQLMQILVGYNHVLTRDGKGDVIAVTIIGKKQAGRDPGIVLPIRLQGQHLTVPVMLSGDGRLWQSLDMIVDTGADTVVLPESLIEPLGLTAYPFSRQRLQTANGMVDAKVAVLQELRLEGATVSEVEAAFIADDQLGGNSLLGMNILGRYNLQIDDTRHVMTLFKK